MDCCPHKKKDIKKEPDGKKVILYILLFIVFIFLIFSLTFFFIKNSSQEKYNEFVSAEQEDKCVTPPGYNEQEWKEHMSHHPDRYKGCL